MTHNTGRVVVIGASMAGLIAARALADAANEVLILDRDELPSSPQWRKGVPQGRHAHALLRAGEQILEDLFPGLIRDLVARGGQRFSWFADVLWWQFDGYRTRIPVFLRRGPDEPADAALRSFYERLLQAVADSDLRGGAQLLEPGTGP